MKERRQSPIYVVVTPVRDEEDYVPLVIESVTQQTLRPLEWVLVNDGSVDRTGAIIDDAEKKLRMDHGNSPRRTVATENGALASSRPFMTDFMH